MPVVVAMEMTHPNGSTASIRIKVHEDWAPLGAKRFLELIDAQYFVGCPLYRVIKDFIIQWGIPADPSSWQRWGENKIMDEPLKVSNRAGTLTFAHSGPNKRGSQIFVNMTDNKDLDTQGFTPFAELVDADDALSYFLACGDGSHNFDQVMAKEKGKEYFEKFPDMSVWSYTARV